jgi:hypothetical protein
MSVGIKLLGGIRRLGWVSGRMEEPLVGSHAQRCTPNLLRF